MATPVRQSKIKDPKIPIKTKDLCCPRFHCGRDDDLGYIQGEYYEMKNIELEPLTTYFHNALYTRKTIKGAKTAIDFYDRTLTFNELSTFSTAIALQLIDRVTLDESNTEGVGDVIFAICLPLSEKLVPAIFAILKTGAAYLPVDPECPEEILLAILRRFKPKVLITDESGPILCKYNSDDFSDVCPIISIEELWLNIDLPSVHCNLPCKTGERPLGKRRGSLFRKEPHSFPFIINTSPTTKERLAVVIQNTRLIGDNPQGVRISHLNIMHHLSWGWRKLPFTKDGNCCLTVPVASFSSILQIFSPLLRGITLHVLAKRDMKMMGTFIHVIGEKRITIINADPVTFDDFINECFTFKRSELKSVLKHLKYVLCRGRLPARESVAQFLTLFPSGKLLLCLYGHPEISGDIVCEKFTGHVDVEHKTVLGRLIVGKTSPNTRIYILDSNMNQVEDGEQGQICIAGIPVVLGYVDDVPDAGAFIENPHNSDKHPNFTRLFCTGDYGRMVRCRDRHLRLLIEGRVDNLIHHQGNDFTMDDIGKSVLSMPEVDKVYLQLLRPGIYDQAVVAYVVLKTKYKNKTLLGELDFQLRSKLPDFMIPEVVLIDQIPTLETGRVDTGKLLHLYEAARDTGSPDWSHLHLLTREQLEAAKILLKGLYKCCSVPIEVSMSALHLSAYDLGCTSNNTVSLFMYITSNTYPVSLQDLLSHASLLDLIKSMAEKHRELYPGEEEAFIDDVPPSFKHLKSKNEYYTVHLEEEHKKPAIRLLAACYSEKGALEQYNMAPADEYVAFLESLWPQIVKAGLSLICIRAADHKIVGVLLAHDFFTDLEDVNLKGALHNIIEFEHAIKLKFLNEIPHQVNNTLQGSLLGTLTSCKPKENVRIVALLLTELYKLARDKNFANIYVTTSNQLVADMCQHMMRYILLEDYIAQTYMDTKTNKPFQLAPSTVSVKALLFNLRSPTITAQNSASSAVTLQK